MAGDGFNAWMRDIVGHGRLKDIANCDAISQGSAGLDRVSKRPGCDHSRTSFLVTKPA